MKAGVPDQLTFGDTKKLKLTTLELVFIILFAMVIASFGSNYMMRKWYHNNFASASMEDAIVQDDVIKAKKLIVVMNGTLETINDDIEKSQNKLKQLKNEI